MLTKCANPSCNTPFLYLREGRLYQMEVGELLPGAPQLRHQSGPAEERKPGRRLEFFWLCGRCAQQMSLVFQRGYGVVVVPVPSQGAGVS